MSRKTIEAKVVVLGNQGVGKTSLILRRVGNSFAQDISPTVGAGFFSFSMVVDGYHIKLQVWDTAGQERFHSMAPMYYRGANAAIIVYDITSEKSFEEAKRWISELKGQTDESMVMCVVGNKCDLSERRAVSVQKGENLAQDIGAQFLETSASENVGIKEVFAKLAQSVSSNMSTIRSSNRLSELSDGSLMGAGMLTPDGSTQVLPEYAPKTQTQDSNRIPCSC
ncbi:hypothetical protein EMCRGX_G030707 [Ephydatia muelleri]